MKQTGRSLWLRLESLEALVKPAGMPMFIRVFFGAPEEREAPSFCNRSSVRVRSESRAALAEAAASPRPLPIMTDIRRLFHKPNRSRVTA